MIELEKKENCCGCTACQQICPKQCIVMKEDDEGFLYPSINYQTCVDCQLCEKVCPENNRYEIPMSKPLSYGAKTYDEELRAKSSSGGIFTILAEKIIDKGGVVFGARFLSDWSVAHDYTDSKEGLSVFRGSKYVQSKLGDSFKNVKKFLNEGRYVLFSGTPCQVSGLNHFLGKKYDNLFTLDLVCHSISSPKVWRLYLQEIQGNSNITYITFRDKDSLGWRNYGLLIKGENKRGEDVVLAKGGHIGKNANLFMKGFTTNLITRPSCYSCPARNYTSRSDIMIADFWHLDLYHPNWDDNKGMSQVLVLTEKGQKLLENVSNDIFINSIPYDEVEERGQHLPITSSTKQSSYRNSFFSSLDKENVVELLRHYTTKDYYHKCIIAFMKSFGNILGIGYFYRLCKKIKK